MGFLVEKNLQRSGWKSNVSIYSVVKPLSTSFFSWKFGGYRLLSSAYGLQAVKLKYILVNFSNVLLSLSYLSTCEIYFYFPTLVYLKAVLW